MILYDDLEPSEKIKIYDKGVSISTSVDGIYSMLIDYRVGDMLAPQLDMAEALHTELLHFLDCVENGQHPLTDGEAGLRAPSAWGIMLRILYLLLLGPTPLLVGQDPQELLPRKRPNMRVTESIRVVG